MSLDPRTLALVVGLASLLQVAALYAQYRVGSARSGIACWTLGSAAFALGFAANMMREMPRIGPFAVLANQLFFMLGACLNLIGIIRFFHREVPVRRLLGLLGAALLLVAWFTFGQDSLAARRVIFSLSIAVLSLEAAWVLWTGKRPAIKSSVNFLVGVFSAYGAFFLARAATPLLGIASEGTFAASPLQVLSYFVAFAGGILWSFGFIILVNQGLNAENQEAREHFEAIFNTSPDAVLLTRLADGKVVDLNSGFTALTGHSREALVGRVAEDLSLWDNPADRGQVESALAAEGAVQNLEFVFRHKAGHRLTGMISARLVTLRDQPHVLSVIRDISTRKQAEALLQAEEQKYRLLTENMKDVVWVMDAETLRFSYVSPSVEALRGYKPEEILGEPMDVALTPESAAAVRGPLAERVAAVRAGQIGPDQYFTDEVEQPRKDGTTVWTEVIVNFQLNAKSGHVEARGVTRDISDRKRAEEALRAKEHMLSDVIENNGALIFVKDRSGRYELVNKKWETVTGMARESVLGRCDVELFPGEVGQEFRRTDLEVMRQGHVVEEEEFLRDGSGERCFLSIKFPLWDSEHEVCGLCGIATEITQRKLDEKRIQELVAQLEVERDYAQASAATDGLTRLANRRHFDDVLNAEFYRLKRSGAQLSLIMLDVDHFKKFNDQYGHLAGDDCLRRVAGVLKAVVGRASDLAARYGGEEFAVILPETELVGAQTMAERIRRSIEALAIPHAGNGGVGCVTVSLGVVTRHATTLDSPEKIIELADEALYRAKVGGRNRVELAQGGVEAVGAHSSFIRLVWREAGESGNALIDSQHKSLFEHANRVLAAILADHPKAACAALLEDLLAEIANHFQDEERLIRASGFPFAEHHAKCHTELVAKAVRLAGKFERDELPVGELFTFLAYDVVAQHMFLEDRKFFPYL